MRTAHARVGVWPSVRTAFRLVNGAEASTGERARHAPTVPSGSKRAIQRPTATAESYQSVGPETTVGRDHPSSPACTLNTVSGSERARCRAWSTGAVPGGAASDTYGRVGSSRPTA